MTLPVTTGLRADPPRPSRAGIVQYLADLYAYLAGQGAPPVVASVSLDSSGGTITHTFASGYDYWLEVDGAVTLTDAVSVYLRANGVSTSSYAHIAMSDTSASPSVTPSGSNSDTQITLKGTASTIGNGTGESFDATIKIKAPASTAVHKRFIFECGWADLNGEEAHTFGSGRYKSTDALTSIFIGATGATPHFSAGTATLYRSKRP